MQRHLPRPTEINDSILRGAPHKDQKYRALYEVGCCVRMLCSFCKDTTHKLCAVRIYVALYVLFFVVIPEDFVYIFVLFRQLSVLVVEGH